MNTALIPEGVAQQWANTFDPDKVDAVAVYRLEDVDEGTVMGYVGMRILPEDGLPAVWGWFDTTGTKESQAPYHSVEEATDALINEWGQI